MFIYRTTLNAHKKDVRCLDLDTKNNLILSGSRDGFVKTWLDDG